MGCRGCGVGRQLVPPEDAEGSRHKGLNPLGDLEACEDGSSVMLQMERVTTEIRW
jgi:hypothetical protein